MRENPKPFEIYQHFKGNQYQILTLAKDSEDGRDLVVYQALYGDYAVYVRDLAQFMSPVDKAKYPASSQQYRFEKKSKVQVSTGAVPTGLSVRQQKRAHSCRREKLIWIPRSLLFWMLTVMIKSWIFWRDCIIGLPRICWQSWLLQRISN